MEVLVKTTLKHAEDVAGGDKILVGEDVREVYDAFTVEFGRYADVHVELSDGETLSYGCFQMIEVVEK